MSLRVEPYQPAHYLEAVTVADPQRFHVLNPHEAGHRHLQGPAYSGFVDDCLAICAGILTPWAGAGRLWAVVTAAGLEYGRRPERGRASITDEVTRRLLGLADDMKLVRLDAECCQDYAEAVRWLTVLSWRLVRAGWQPDYITRKAPVLRAAPVHKPKYGPGGMDFLQWGWFR